jgi:hypothetical protein
MIDCSFDGEATDASLYWAKQVRNNAAGKWRNGMEFESGLLQVARTAIQVKSAS